jgi:hypothetical protein
VAASSASIAAAAAVIVCVDATRPSSLERLRSFWLPEVGRLNPGAPVVVAVCKDDREDKMDLVELREVIYVWGWGGVGGGWVEGGGRAATLMTHASFPYAPPPRPWSR